LLKQGGYELIHRQNAEVKNVNGKKVERKNADWDKMSNGKIAY
jgi:hypothetical protein